MLSNSLTKKDSAVCSYIEGRNNSPLLFKEKRYPLALKYAGKELSRICQYPIVIVVRVTEKGFEIYYFYLK